MAKITLQKAAKESFYATLIITGTAAAFVGILTLIDFFYQIAGIGGVVCELVAAIFLLLTIARYISGRFE
jgi:hypothetical protein